MFLKSMVSIFSVLIIVSTEVFACGGQVSITNNQITSSKEVAAIVAKIKTTYGKDLAIESIHRTGRGLLSIDKEEVARVMCNANYVHVFFASSSADGLRCMTAFEPLSGGRVPSADLKVSCLPTGGQFQTFPVSLQF